VNLVVYSYRWQYNDAPLNVSAIGGRIRLATDSGTLIFTETTAGDEGIYQCIAYSAVGTAVSGKVNLRQGSKLIVVHVFCYNRKEETTVLSVQNLFSITVFFHSP